MIEFMMVVVAATFLFFATSVWYHYKASTQRVPFLPAAEREIEAMLALANVRPGERWVDLGSGDGRILLAAANRGATVVGYEFNWLLIALTRYRIWSRGLGEVAEVRHADFWEADLSGFDVVSVFLTAARIRKLQEKLENGLKPGARVVSNWFRFPDWTPAAVRDGVYLYRR